MSAEQSPPLPAGLLTYWGIPPGARLTATHGTNNKTFVVSAGSARWVLRISQNLTTPQIRAEHRLLAQLRQAGLPFAVPEPLPALTGDFLAETATGPATVTKWLRVQDLVVGLKQSDALDAPDWQRRAAALARGYCGAQELTEAEAAAVPELLLARATGTVVWRAGRWRRGQASLDDVSECSSSRRYARLSVKPATHRSATRALFPWL